MEALSDDYYKEIEIDFLISEYERAKLEKQKYLLLLDKGKR